MWPRGSRARRGARSRKGRRWAPPWAASPRWAARAAAPPSPAPDGTSPCAAAASTAAPTAPPAGRSSSNSNDTWGISWVASTGALFDRLVFVLTDASDQGATLTVSAGGVSTALANLGNANRKIVSVFFDELVSSAGIVLTNTRGSSLFLNDGFGIDDVAVNLVQPAAQVPLPAGLALLAGALGTLAALRRRA